MFDNEKLNVRVSMTGKEYMEYKNSNKINLKSKKVQGIAIIIFSLILLIYPAFMITEFFNDDPKPKPLFSGWYEAMPIMAKLSWSNIGKLSFLYFAPFLVIMIAIAWVIHGFGFFLFKG